MDIDDAAARARRARAVEELRRLSKLADEAEGRLSTVTKSDDTPAAAEQECNHFSIRGYFLQKKDPKLCSPHFFRNQPQHDEHHDSSPVLVPKFHRWDCSKCLDRLRVSKEQENVSKAQHGANYGSSIPHKTRPSIQKVDPPYPLGPPASPSEEETRSEVASNFLTGDGEEVGTYCTHHS